MAIMILGGLIASTALNLMVMHTLASFLSRSVSV